MAKLIDAFLNFTNAPNILRKDLTGSSGFRQAGRVTVSGPLHQYRPTGYLE
jgi:hypothetical protein